MTERDIRQYSAEQNEEQRVEFVRDERENVLENLVELRVQEREPGPFIVERLLTDCDFLFVTGEPGIGKSLLSEQIKSAVERNATLRGQKVNVVMKFYDDYLRAAENLRGDRNNWDNAKWQALNKEMYEDLKEKPHPQNEHERARNITIAEFPGVGNVKPRDRGVTLLHELLEDIGKEKKTKSMLVFVTTNRLLQLKSEFLRSTILSTPDKDVVNVLRSHKHTVGGALHDEEKGKLVKRMFGKSAAGTHMQTIREEERRKFDSHNKDFSDASGQITSEMIQDVYREFNAPLNDDLSQIRLDSYTAYALDQAAYMENLMQKAGLDQNNGLIVHNPPHDQWNEISLERLLRQRDSY